MRVGCIGAVTVDTIVRHGASLKAPGGTSFFAALALAALKNSVTIVTAYGYDWKPYEEELSSYGISTVNLKPSSTSTAFKITYGERGRTLILLRPSEEIKPDESLLKEFDAIVLGPVARELPTHLACQIPKMGISSAVGIQGYVRRFAPEGRVYVERTDLSFLKNSYLISGSATEFKIALGKSHLALKIGARYVIISKGRAGATLYGGSSWHARSQGNGSDPTGAGDILMAIAFYSLLSGFEEGEAIERATALASASTQGSGFKKFDIIKQATSARRSRMYFDDVSVTKLVRFPDLLSLIGHASPNPGVLEVLSKRSVQRLSYLTNSYIRPEYHRLAIRLFFLGRLQVYALNTRHLYDQLFELV